jgi:hypothetical protein
MKNIQGFAWFWFYVGMQKLVKFLSLLVSDRADQKEADSFIHESRRNRRRKFYDKK